MHMDKSSSAFLRRPTAWRQVRWRTFAWEAWALLAAAFLSLEADGDMEDSGHVVMLFGLKSLLQLLVRDFERVISRSGS